MKSETTEPRLQSILHRVRPWLVELWIASVVIVFFVIRVLGSGIGKRILSSLGIRHLP